MLIRLPVFVTGNANKLKEVKAILAAGGSGIEVTSQAIDGMSQYSSPPLLELPLDHPRTSHSQS